MGRKALILAAVAAIILISGSALAASRWIITSPKQIKPSVLQQLRGHRGSRGPQGPQGIAGPPGAAGNPAAYPTVLPNGQTEVGTYAVRYPAGVTHVSEDAVVSFPLPLASAPAVACGGGCYNTGLFNPPVNLTSCPGSVTAPTAAPGTFCFYPGLTYNVDILSTVDPLGGPPNSISRFGGSIEVDSANTGDTFETGTWAVTAENPSSAIRAPNRGAVAAG